jgi:hypothetical protein
MGLSKTERLEKFYYGVYYWINDLKKLSELIPEENYTGKEKINGWIKRLETLIGEQIICSDNNPMYWILGENDDNFQSVMFESYGRFSNNNDFDDSLSLFNIPKEYKSYNWFSDLTLEKFAILLTTNEFKENKVLVRIAKWWDTWHYVGAILYTVKRYNDSLFSRSIQNELTNIIGEMAMGRFEIYPDYKFSDQVSVFSNLEKILYAKKRIFDSLIEKAKKPSEFERSKDCSEEENNKKLKEHYRIMGRDVWKEGMNLIEQVGELTINELELAIHNLETETYNKEKNIKDPEVKKNDSIFGVKKKKPEKKSKSS